MDNYLTKITLFLQPFDLPMKWISDFSKCDASCSRFDPPVALLHLRGKILIYAIYGILESVSTYEYRHLGEIHRAVWVSWRSFPTVLCPSSSRSKRHDQRKNAPLWEGACLIKLGALRDVRNDTINLSLVFGKPATCRYILLRHKEVNGTHPALVDDGPARRLSRLVELWESEGPGSIVFCPTGIWWWLCTR